MSIKTTLLAWAAAHLAAGSLAAADKPAGFPKDYKLLYEQKFESADSLKEFAMTDAAAWRISRTGDQSALELHKQSDYKPRVRSPVNIALIADKVFGDFVLEVEMQQTGREYGHRDMCIYFGLQDPEKFYYVHMATSADPNAHNVFIVNGAPRKNFAKETTKGVNWGTEIWHTIRIERKASEGTIKVFYDDMTKPIMIAEDSTFQSGYIGFGSFDDTGKIDNIRIWGPALESKRTEFFDRPYNN